MKKFLVALIAIIPMIFVSNVKALSTDKGEFPDVPTGYSNSFIIKDENDNYKLYASEDEAMESYDSVLDYMLASDNSDFYYTHGTNVSWAIFHVFNLNSDSWVDSSSPAQSINLENNEMIYSGINFYQGDNLVYASGYGTEVAGLFENANVVIGGTMTALAGVTTSLISNPIFQIMFGLLILGLVIGLVSYLVRKAKRRG